MHFILSAQFWVFSILISVSVSDISDNVACENESFSSCFVNWVLVLMTFYINLFYPFHFRLFFYGPWMLRFIAFPPNPITMTCVINKIAIGNTTLDRVCFSNFQLPSSFDYHHVEFIQIGQNENHQSKVDTNILLNQQIVRFST